MKKSILVSLIIFFSFAMMSCASLLPSSQNLIKSPYQSYEEVNTIYGKIIPGETTLKQLEELGITELTNREIITYRDILMMYLPNSSIKKEDLDIGIQKCLDAKNRSFGYAITLKNISKKRTGNFLADFFRFKRKVQTTGWEFEGLILIVDNVVVYKERAGGKPDIAEEETKKNPLGPVPDGGTTINTGKKLLD